MTPSEPARRPDLSSEQRLWLRQTIDALLPGATVCVFGSRANGRARPFSDLDLLLVDPPRLPLALRAALVDAFEAGPLPFRVDLVERDGLWPGMVDRVLGEAVPL